MVVFEEEENEISNGESAGKSCRAVRMNGASCDGKLIFFNCQRVIYALWEATVVVMFWS